MTFLDKLLSHYQITSKDLCKRCLLRSFDLLTLPTDDTFKSLVNAINEDIKENKKFIIYGDYDVDGLTATAIMKMTLDRLKATSGFFIPSRYVEGYGLNIDRVKQFYQKGYQVIITVDNGIKAFDAIRYAKELGMKVYVIDHHQPGENLPECDEIFHQGISKFTSYNCSAASLVFFLSHALLDSFDDYFATLAGIAVFSDVMPLVDNNLILANIAKDNINRYQYSNLTKLINSNRCSFDDISFKIIPALNSVGRIKKDSLSTNNCCRFLIYRDDTVSINRYLSFINDCNDERKRIVKEMTFTLPLSTTHCKSMIANDYSGLTGLFANRIMQEDKIPVIVFAKADSDTLVGSIRMPLGYSASQFLEKEGTKLIQSGGHDRACGITIYEKDYFQVATDFMMYCEKQALEVKEDSEKTISIDLEELNESNFDTLSRFEPFDSENFKAPLFSMTSNRDQLIPSKNGNAYFVYSASKKSKITVFSSLEIIKDSSASSFIFTGKFKKDVFNNSVSYSLLVEKITPFTF